MYFKAVTFLCQCVFPRHVSAQYSVAVYFQWYRSTPLGTLFQGHKRSNHTKVIGANTNL